MIRGVTKNLLIAPATATDVDQAESFAPHQIALYNGHVTPLGNWARRPGYHHLRRPSQLAPIVALIPDGLGYVVTSDGRFYRHDRFHIGTNIASQREIQRLVDALLQQNAGQLQAIRAQADSVHELLRLLGTALESDLLQGTLPTIADVLLVTNAATTSTALAAAMLALTQSTPPSGPAAEADIRLIEQLAQQLTAFCLALAAQVLNGPIPDVSELLQVTAMRVTLDDVASRFETDFVTDISTIVDRVAALEEPLLMELVGARLDGNDRPTWGNYDGTVLLANGGSIVALAPDSAVPAPLAGMPPAAKFIVVMDSYVIAAGWDDITFGWSRVNTKDQWPAENFNEVLAEGEQIKMVKKLRQALYFFKSKSIEIWVDIGGTTVWARQGVIERGTGAGHSVVQAADTFFWLGNDLDFYVLNGNQAQVISGDNRARIVSLTHPEEVYGFDFRNEHLIRWFAPSDGRCFVWDYQRNLFSEDYAWRDDSQQLLPIGAYMERGGKAYVGSSEVAGYLSEWDRTISDDAGEPIRVERQFRVGLSQDDTTGRVNRLRLRVQRGKGMNDTAPRLLVRWAFDEGEWEPYEEIDLGAEGDTDPYVDLAQLGIGSEMRLELIETDAVDALVTHAMLTVEGLGR